MRPARTSDCVNANPSQTSCGIYGRDQLSTPRFQNNLLWWNNCHREGGNTAASDELLLDSSQYNATIGGNLHHYHPQWVDFAAWDLRVQSSSPAVNAGTPYWASATDFNGVARPQGGVPDIGAYEQ